MAKVRFPLKKYATVELNRCGFLKNGLVVSQMPLGKEFTEAAPCENGMIVNCTKTNHEVTLTPGEDPVLGLVYTTEKEWNQQVIGMNQHYNVAGEYPRVGILQRGDTFTTSCFQYDDGEFNDVPALEEAFSTLDSAPLYLSGLGAMEVSASKAPGAYARVIEYTTVPNGEKAIKCEVM